MGNLLPSASAWAGLEMLGPDAVDFGHRMFSRDIKNLKPLTGALSLFLTAEGRVCEVFWVIRLPNLETLLLLTPCGRVESLRALIEKYHFAERFELKAWSPSPVFSSWKQVVGGASTSSLDPETFVFKAVWRETEFEMALRKDYPSSTVSPEEELSASWQEQRVDFRIPEMGVDFPSEKQLVFDLGLEDLCEENKGCYIGQEVVERIRTKGGGGAALKTLATIAFDPKSGSAIGAEEELTAPGEVGPVGRVAGTILRGKGRALAIVKRGLISGPLEAKTLHTALSKVSAKIVR